MKGAGSLCRSLAAAAVLATAFAGSPVQSSAPAEPVELRGLRLGMEPSAAEKMLLERGYRPVETVDGWRAEEIDPNRRDYYRRLPYNEMGFINDCIELVTSREGPPRVVMARWKIFAVGDLGMSAAQALRPFTKPFGRPDRSQRRAPPDWAGFTYHDRFWLTADSARDCWKTPLAEEDLLWGWDGGDRPRFDEDGQCGAGIFVHLIMRPGGSAEQLDQFVAVLFDTEMMRADNHAWFAANPEAPADRERRARSHGCGATMKGFLGLNHD